MKSSIISAVVALAAFAKTPAEVPKEHRYPDAAQGGHLLVLQCGSDWCESGEDVRKVFESATFRDALGSGWEFAVYDDMDAPTPDVKAANEPLSKLRVESKRFPAITCLTPEPRRFFAQLENIPFDVTAKALAAQVAAATSAKDEAVRLFGMAKALRRTTPGLAISCLMSSVKSTGLRQDELNEKLIKKQACADFPPPWNSTKEWDREWSNDRRWS